MSKAVWGAHRELGERNGDLGEVARLPWMIRIAHGRLVMHSAIQTCRLRVPGSCSAASFTHRNATIACPRELLRSLFQQVVLQPLWGVLVNLCATARNIGAMKLFQDQNHDLCLIIFAFALSFAPWIRVCQASQGPGGVVSCHYNFCVCTKFCSMDTSLQGLTRTWWSRVLSPRGGTVGGESRRTRFLGFSWSHAWSRYLRQGGGSIKAHGN